MIATRYSSQNSGACCQCRGEIGEVAAARAERFVRTIKESCLERMILFGEGSLRTAISQFGIHYLKERNHQGLANRIIDPEPGCGRNTGAVERRQRLGGMLNYCYRAA